MLAVIAAVVGVNVLVVLARPLILWTNFARFQQTAEKIILYEEGSRPDVVFMGTSRAFQAFDPDVFNDELESQTGRRVRAINMATASGTIEINYLMLKNIITEEKKPSVIVYGLAEFEMVASRRGSMLADPRYGYLLLAPDDIVTPYTGTTALEKMSFVVQQACPLCRYRELIRNGVNIVLNPDYPGHAVYLNPPSAMHIDTGFYAFPVNSPLPRADLEKQRQDFQASLKTFHPTAPSMELFAELLELARQRGIVMLVVNLPVSAEFLSIFPPENLSEYLSVVHRIAHEQGVPFVDLYTDGYAELSAKVPGNTRWGSSPAPTDAQVVPPPGFADFHHLNMAGADLVTRRVTREALAALVAQTIAR